MTPTVYNINIDEAESYGAELAARYNIGNWSFNGAYSYTRSEQKTGANEGLPLVQQPKHLFTLNTTYRLLNGRNLVALDSEGRKKLPLRLYHHALYFLRV